MKKSPKKTKADKKKVELKDLKAKDAGEVKGGGGPSHGWDVKENKK